MSTTAIALPAPTTFSIFLTETRYEFLRLLRTRVFSFSVIGFPVMFYVLFGIMLNRHADFGGNTSAANYLLGGYAVFGALGAALFGVGVSLASELGAGWLELKRASPMPPIAYLAAKCVNAMAFGAIIVSLLTALGIVFGHVSITFAQFAQILGLAVACAIPFASIGLLIAQLVPMNSAPGITNLIYLPMSFFGGLWLPVAALPVTLQKIAVILPTYHAGQLALRIVAPHTIPNPATATHWLYLTGFTIVILAIAAAVFHRREQNA